MSKPDVGMSYKDAIVFFVLLLMLMYVLTGCAPVQGPRGETGLPGATGPQGSPGIPGLPGLDATPITTVSFCGGPSVYPSNFPEYGIVIGGNIYGVYSANGGFLALLPPGLYLSNAIGSTCTFTINVNGTITR